MHGSYMCFPLYINSSCAHKRNLPPNSIVPSAQIMKDAEKYYTNQAAERFTVGILARIEKIQLNSHVRFTECVEKAVQIKEELYKNHSLKVKVKHFSKSYTAKKIGHFKNGRKCFQRFHRVTILHTLQIFKEVLPPKQHV